MMADGDSAEMIEEGLVDLEYLLGLDAELSRLE
jgi:hypothetical protein